jgi:hypothetical protein
MGVSTARSVQQRCGAAYRLLLGRSLTGTTLLVPQPRVTGRMAWPDTILVLHHRWGHRHPGGGTLRATAAGTVHLLERGCRRCWGCGTRVSQSACATDVLLHGERNSSLGCVGDSCMVTAQLPGPRAAMDAAGPSACSTLRTSDHSRSHASHRHGSHASCQQVPHS